MNELKLQIREHIIPDEKFPFETRLTNLELIGTLPFKVSGKCRNCDSIEYSLQEYKERLKNRIAQTFYQTLYGQIIRAIDKAEYETRANCFNYSFSAEDKIKTAFEELRNSIPQITYD